MLDNDLLKYATHIAEICANTANTVLNASQDLVENCTKGKYVTREEFEQLQKLVLELHTKINTIITKYEK